MSKWCCCQGYYKKGYIDKSLQNESRDVILCCQLVQGCLVKFSITKKKSGHFKGYTEPLKVWQEESKDRNWSKTGSNLSKIAQGIYTLYRVIEENLGMSIQIYVMVPECRVLKDLNQDYISIYCMLSNNYNNTSLEALGALAQRLQHVTACNTSSPCPLNPKWPTESGNRLNLRLLDPPINFRKISFLIKSFLLWDTQKSKMAAREPQNGRRGLE